MNEEYRGVGRKDRRLMIKLWKESGTDLSLKKWAERTGAGHVANAWINAKRGSNGI